MLLSQSSYLALALGDVAKMLGTGTYVWAAAARCLCPAGATHFYGVRIHRVLSRVKLGHIRHHDSHRGSNCGQSGSLYR